MSRAVLAQLVKMEAYVTENWGRMWKIYVGQGNPGARAAPTQTGTNDSKLGLRIDFGDVVTKEDGKQYTHFKLQVNKNAENPTLKKMADKNPHKVVGEAFVLVPSDEDKAAGKPNASKAGQPSDASKAGAISDASKPAEPSIEEKVAGAVGKFFGDLATSIKAEDE